MTGRNNEEIWSAAEKANQEFGQWMPQRWIECFIAALSAPVEAPVAVKPLEWTYSGNGVWLADKYRIRLDCGETDLFIVSGWQCGTNPYETLSAAKAAAQMDYETHIRSALIATPRPLPSRDSVAQIVATNCFNPRVIDSNGKPFWKKSDWRSAELAATAILTLLGGSAHGR